MEVLMPNLCWIKYSSNSIDNSATE